VLSLVGEAVRRQRRVEERCLDLLAGEGFELVHLPVLEYAAGEGGKGYRFVDPSGHLVALRTDFTPLAARVLAPLVAASREPISVCYAGEVLRPQPARLRQIPELYQLGFERYRVESEAAAALTLLLRLLGEAGVELAGCHVSVSLAGLIEQLLAQLIGGPPGDDELELARVKDVDALAEAVGAHDAGRHALEGALLAPDSGDWTVFFGVQAAMARLVDLVRAAREAGAQASVEVAPRLAGAYYNGAVFSVWGAGTRAPLGGGGEYVVETSSGRVSAVGAGLALGVALEEAACGA
jgi:ATP phosphoribosyltransferase regulatory subunit